MEVWWREVGNDIDRWRLGLGFMEGEVDIDW